MGTRGNWWSQTGSNRRPLACHASALPAELWPHSEGANSPELPPQCQRFAKAMVFRAFESWLWSPGRATRTGWATLPSPSPTASASACSAALIAATDQSFTWESATCPARGSARNSAVRCLRAALATCRSNAVADSRSTRNGGKTIRDAAYRSVVNARPGTPVVSAESRVDELGGLKRNRSIVAEIPPTARIVRTSIFERFFALPSWPAKVR